MNLSPKVGVVEHRDFAQAGQQKTPNAEIPPACNDSAQKIVRRTARVVAANRVIGPQRYFRIIRWNRVLRHFGQTHFRCLWKLRFCSFMAT